MDDFVPTRGLRLALRVCTIFLAFLLAFSLCGADAAGDVASWTTEGPCGGYINSLAMAATNPDIIYAGTDSGLSKTVDGGVGFSLTVLLCDSVTGFGGQCFGKLLV